MCLNGTCVSLCAPFIMGYLVAMEIRDTLFLSGQFLYMLHSIGPINVCTNFEMSRYKIDEVRKYAKFVFYLTSRDAKLVRRFVMGTPTVLIGILIRHIVKPTRSLYDFRYKSYGSNSGFRLP